MTATTLSIPSGALELQGTFTAPSSAPSPAALLISGSGPIDRDSNAKRLPIGVMGLIADHLASNGIASLRYDKRGVGESQGDYRAAGFHDNVADARAALELLRARPQVDADRVFVIGHSEGALIASVLASGEDLAGVVLLAGAAQTGREVLRWQARQIGPTLPKPVRWLMKVLRQDLERSQAKRLDRIEGSTEDVIRIQFVRLNAKWFREFMAFDPSEALARAAVPVLAITGDKDLQVDPGDLAAMEQAVPTQFSGHLLEDVTHLLREEPGPASLRTYKKQARRPLDGRLLELITEWIGVDTTGEAEQRPTTYEDEGIVLNGTGITIKHYHRPGRARHVPYDAIERAEQISLGFGTGRYRLVGISPGRPRHFFHWDAKRTAKDRGVSLDVGGWRRIAITPDDPDHVLSLIDDRIEG